MSARGPLCAGVSRVFLLLLLACCCVHLVAAQVDMNSTGVDTNSTGDAQNSSTSDPVSSPGQSTTSAVPRRTAAPTTTGGSVGGGGGDEEDPDGEDDEPTPVTYTDVPGQNTTVCSSVGLLNTFQIYVFQAQGCVIINGSMILRLDKLVGVPIALLRMPSVRHITASLAVFDNTSTFAIRDLLPNLIAVHGKANSVNDYVMFMEYIMKFNFVVAFNDIINVTLVASPGSVREKSDGIALLSGNFVQLTLERLIYTVPTPAQNPTVCVGGVPVAPTNTTTFSCCTKIYDSTFQCPNSVSLTCANNAQTFSRGGVPTATFKPAIFCRKYAGPGLDQCVDLCPPDTALFQDRLCLPRCPSIRRFTLTKLLVPEDYFAFFNTTQKQSECLLTCPAHYQPDARVSKCRMCSKDPDSGRLCNRKCGGAVVKSLTQLCNFVGCTEITDDLILSINNPGLIPACLASSTGVTTLQSALTRAFGAVRRIRGYLILLNNICMYDLNFLVSLEEVLAPKPISQQYRIVIQNNVALEDISGLRNLVQIGPILLENLPKATQIGENFLIRNNDGLCQVQLLSLYIGLTDDPANALPPGGMPQNLSVTLSTSLNGNAPNHLCPISRFALNATGASETSVNISWPAPSEDANNTVYKQYLYYVETRGSINPHLRDIIIQGGSKDFSCAARLEPWSMIVLKANATSHVITNLHICSEFAFQLDVVYNNSGTLNTANTSLVALGRPRIPLVLPAPSNLKFYQATEETISISWSKPEYACQTVGQAFTYQVYWQLIQVQPPVTQLTLDGCGKLCYCSSRNFFGQGGQIETLMYSFRDTFGGEIIFSSGTPSSVAASSVNLITPAGCLNESVENCCPEGVLVHTGYQVFNDTGVFNNAGSGQTKNMNFTIKRDRKQVFSTYLVNVQAIHGPATDTKKMSNTAWSAAANVSSSNIADVIAKAEAVYLSVSNNVKLTWRAPTILNSPIILHQIMMTARSRRINRGSADVENIIDYQLVECLQAYCLKLLGVQNCVNITLNATAAGKPQQLGVVGNVTNQFTHTDNGTTTTTLLDVRCLSNTEANVLGDILFQVRAITLGGCGRWSPAGSITLGANTAAGDSSGATSGLSGNQRIAIGVGTFAAVLVIGLLILYSIRLTSLRAKSTIEAMEIREMLDRVMNHRREGVFDTQSYDEASGDVVPDEWEVGIDDLTLLGELGHGNFGQVVEGRMRKWENEKEVQVTVAIKMVHEDATRAQRREFLEESMMMKSLDCPHLVRLVGLVTQGETYAIMEFMEHGDLKHYLRSIRPEKRQEGGFNKVIPTDQLFRSWALQIAKALEYLGSRKMVHRDLAARNCMLDSSLGARVGDFGLARDVYSTDYYRRESKTALPLRWLAPESIKDGVFAAASDVWAYGIVLYEMSTLARQPYLGSNNEEVVRLLIHGGCMDVPTPEVQFPNDVARLMPLCWKYDPSDRITFTEIVETMEQELEHYV